MKTRSCISVVLAAAALSGAAHGQTVYLGALEEVRDTSETISTKVRVLFSHGKRGWAAFESDCPDSDCLQAAPAQYPREVGWFIGLDGRHIGNVRARTPSRFVYYSRIGLQDIVEGRPPVVGKTSYMFSGFSDMKSHRPLVAASKPYFADPAAWRPARTAPQLVNHALRALRSRQPNVCKKGPEPAYALVPFKYTKHDLNIRAHRSSNGTTVMTVAILDAFECDGGDGDGTLNLQTFAVTSAGKIRFLGEGLTLVDAGDYDNDGKAELLFSRSGYNRGGYVLFSSAFVELARFEYSYT